ncbi:MAG: hypothetical protein GY938_32065 [Ketobacter sp.]|nr:hypothetical protein [Ketobacter sp.]
MRVRIDRHNLITLLPDSDADKALLNLWCEMGAKVASHTLEADGLTGLSIGFKDTEPLRGKKGVIGG